MASQLYFCALVVIPLLRFAASDADVLPECGDDACEVDSIEGHTSLLQESLRLSAVKGHGPKLAHAEVASAAPSKATESDTLAELTSGRSGKGVRKNKVSPKETEEEKKARLEKAEHLKQLTKTKEKFKRGEIDEPASHRTLWLMVIGAAIVAACIFLVRPAVAKYYEWHQELEAHKANSGKQSTSSSALVRRLSSGTASHNVKITNSFLQHLMVDADGDHEVENRFHDEMDEDAYSLSIALIIRDLHNLARGQGNAGLKTGRIIYSCGLVFITAFVQLSLVVCTKLYVTPPQVADIRSAYDTFQITMYGEDNTYLNKNGYHRGIPGFFNISNFALLGDDDKENICNIPIGQVFFFMLILFIWSVTVLAQIKKCIERCMSLIVMTETTDTMAKAMTPWHMALVEDPHTPRGQQQQPSGPPVEVITGLTVKIKVLLFTLVILPEFSANCYIMWLGSRWLMATNDWGNVVSNAVALEFILNLKELFFYTLASERNRRELAHTAVAPPWTKEPAGFGVYFIAAVWLILSMAWVWAYVYHLQQVLPDYHWDIHEACAPWMNGLLDPGSDVGSFISW